jgi:hypothetical protein
MVEKTALDKMRAMFKKKQVLDMDQLRKLARTSSRVTVYRHLRKLEYLTSYTHNGKYYTVPDVAQFDKDGFWHSGDIGFSSHGTLMNTLAHVITTSKAGKTNSELEKQFRTRVQNSLQLLMKPNKIAKASQSKPCLYVSPDLSVSEQQIKGRAKWGSNRKKLPDWIIGEILVETIRSFSMSPGINDVVKRLAKRGSLITREQVEQVFEENELEKKTSD